MGGRESFLSACMSDIIIPLCMSDSQLYKAHAEMFSAATSYYQLHGHEYEHVAVYHSLFSKPFTVGIGVRVIHSQKKGRISTIQ